MAMKPVLAGDAEKYQEILNKITLVSALCMAFSFCFSFALFNIGVVILIFSFFLRRILSGNWKLFDGILDSAILLYYLAAVLSVTQSGYLPMSLQGLHKLIRYLLLFIAAREIVTDERSAKWITVCLLLGGSLAAFDAMSQLVIGRDLIAGRTPFLSMEDLIRLGGPFNNPNALAIYLCFFIPLTYTLASSKMKHAKWLLIVLACMTAAVMFTYSRPAAMALTAAGVLIVIVNRVYWLPITACVLAGIAFFFAPPAVKGWLSSLGSWQGFFFDISRHYHHLAAWNMIADSPLLGVGINTFDVNYSKYKVAEDVITRWSAHQAYLQLWAETGILGLSGFCLLILGVFRLMRAAYGVCREHLLKQILLGYAAGAVAFLVIGFFESSLWQPRQTYFFWFFLGISCGIARWMKHAKFSA